MLSLGAEEEMGSLCAYRHSGELRRQLQTSANELFQTRGTQVHDASLSITAGITCWRPPGRSTFGFLEFPEGTFVFSSNCHGK